MSVQLGTGGKVLLGETDKVVADSACCCGGECTVRLQAHVYGSYNGCDDGETITFDCNFDKTFDGLNANDLCVGGFLAGLDQQSTLACESCSIGSPEPDLSLSSITGFFIIEGYPGFTVKVDVDSQFNCDTGCGTGSGIDESNGGSSGWSTPDSPNGTYNFSFTDTEFGVTLDITLTVSACGNVCKPCCYPDGTCSKVSSVDCESGGGESWGTAGDNCSDFTPPCCPCTKITRTTTGLVCWADAELGGCTEAIDFVIEEFTPFGSTGGDFCCNYPGFYGSGDNSGPTFDAFIPRTFTTDCGGFGQSSEEHNGLDCNGDLDITVTVENGPCEPCPGGPCDCDPPTNRGGCGSVTIRYQLESGVCPDE